MQQCCSLSVSSNGKANSSYCVIAFYHLISIADPAKEVALHKEFLSSLDVKSRIYVSPQGINAQMSASWNDGKSYMNWLSSRQDLPSQEIDFKVQPCQEHVFPRLTVKVRKELVALGQEVSLDQRGTYLTPAEWSQLLESKESKIILDTRNEYEWKLGRFEGAELFSCDTFKELGQAVLDLKERIGSTSTKVLMYCTGGIRCELFSALLKKEGIDNVFQLKGGVIRYGEEERSKHWLGKLFVFDDRLAVDIADEPAPAIGTCFHCKDEAESYYNCANMDCNTLFLCCSKCLEQLSGCCQEGCQSSERVRPYEFSHKPFRRWYHYTDTREGELAKKHARGQQEHERNMREKRIEKREL